jgi:hypothetical protein
MSILFIFDPAIVDSVRVVDHKSCEHHFVMIATLFGVFGYDRIVNSKHIVIIELNT